MALRRFHGKLFFNIYFVLDNSTNFGWKKEV